MDRTKKGFLQISYLFLLNALLGIICLLFYLSVPSDAGTAIVFGFSLTRVGLILLLTFSIWGFGKLGLQLPNKPRLQKWVSHIAAEPITFWSMLSLLVLICLVGIFYFLAPSYSIFKPLLGYKFLWVRFALFTSWLTLTSFFSIYELILLRGGKLPNRGGSFLSVVFFLFLCIYLVSIGLGWALNSFP